MQRAVKNNKLTADTWVGQIIEPGEYYIIQDFEHFKWTINDKVSDDIELGDLVVAQDNSGTTDFSPERGAEWLKYSRDRISLTLRGVSRSYSFVDSGLLEGTRWLRYRGGSAPSNKVPAIISQHIQPISLEFTNENAPISMLIDFFRERDGVTSLLFSWDVSGKKSAYKANNLNEKFNPGDRFAVRARQSGLVVAKDVVVNVDFIILNDEKGEGGVS